MALKFKHQSKDEIPEPERSFYVERDGVWLLDVEGAVEKSKLDEFRANNTALLRQLDEHKKRFEGIDPDEVRKLAEEKQQLEEDRQVKAGEIDKVVENRIKGLKTEWEKQVNTLAAERESLNARLTAIQIDQGAITAATKRGLRPTALTDIAARARCAFKLVSGAPRAFEADAQTVRSGKDGVTSFAPSLLIHKSINGLRL